MGAMEVHGKTNNNVRHHIKGKNLPWPETTEEGKKKESTKVGLWLTMKKTKIATTEELHPCDVDNQETLIKSFFLISIQSSIKMKPAGKKSEDWGLEE